MVYGCKRKPVEFNLSNETERRMYEFAQTINFGRFVKSALRIEMERRRINASNSIQVNTAQFMDK